MTLDSLADFITAVMPALAGGLLALASAIVVFSLNQHATRREALRARQDLALGHVLDAFDRLQKHTVETSTDDLKADLADSLLRLVWLLDDGDEVVFDWVEAILFSTLNGLESVHGTERSSRIIRNKTMVVNGMREWRISPHSTKKRLRAAANLTDLFEQRREPAS